MALPEVGPLLLNVAVLLNICVDGEQGECRVGTAIAKEALACARLIPSDVVALAPTDTCIDASAEETDEALDVVVRGCLCVVAQTSPIDDV